MKKYLALSYHKLFCGEAVMAGLYPKIRRIRDRICIFKSPLSVGLSYRPIQLASSTVLLVPMPNQRSLILLHFSHTTLGFAFWLRSLRPNGCFRQDSPSPSKYPLRSSIFSTCRAVFRVGRTLVPEIRVSSISNYNYFCCRNSISIPKEVPIYAQRTARHKGRDLGEAMLSSPIITPFSPRSLRCDF